MPIGQCVHPIFCDPALGVCSKAAHRCDVALTAEHPFHVERSAFRRGPLCTAHHGVLFHALGLLDALSTGLKDAVHLGAQSDIFCDWAPGALILHLAQHLLVPSAVQWMLFLEV